MGDMAHIDTIFIHVAATHTRQHVDACVWQQLEYRIDVCHVTHGAHIEHL